MSSRLLSRADLGVVVRLVPLISIDLIIRNSTNQVLLGFRENEPAKGFYFVPGGRILKNERLRDAFVRILRNEINYSGSFDEARPLGVYEHFYGTNYFGEPDYGTHYVVLAYEIGLKDTSGLRIDSQHREFVWWNEPHLLASEQVHDYTKAYLS
jgi:colanic acid biosynthesis protein WcaH